MAGLIKEGKAGFDLKIWGRDSRNKKIILHVEIEQGWHRYFIREEEQKWDKVAVK